jgi:hypothetical protein
VGSHDVQFEAVLLHVLHYLSHEPHVKSYGRYTVGVGQVAIQLELYKNSGEVQLVQLVALIEHVLHVESHPIQFPLELSAIGAKFGQVSEHVLL